MYEVTQVAPYVKHAFKATIRTCSLGGSIKICIYCQNVFERIEKKNNLEFAG